MNRKTTLIAAVAGVVATMNVANATDQHRIECANPAELTQLSVH